MNRGFANSEKTLNQKSGGELLNFTTNQLYKVVDVVPFWQKEEEIRLQFEFCYPLPG